MEGHWKFLGGGGVKVKILEVKYGAKLEFSWKKGAGWGGGVQNKKPSMWEYGYFLELHHVTYTVRYETGTKESTIMKREILYMCCLV